MAAGRTYRSGNISLKALAVTTSTLALLAIAVSPRSAHAQTYNGNDTTIGPFGYGYQTFNDSSTLNAAAANTVTGGEQNFNTTSTLQASAANAVSGGLQHFKQTSVLNALATNAISGGQQDFDYNSVLNASAFHAIGGGSQYFYGSTNLNLNVANAIGGGAQSFFQLSTLNVRAANALTNNNALIFSKVVGGGIGGFMYLNDFDTVVGRITSAAPDSGWISNGGTSNVTLTIDSSQLGDSAFSGVITDGGGTLALVKRGLGTLTLSGSTGYSGGTKIEGGILQLGGGGSLGARTGQLTVDGAGTLDLGGTSPQIGGLSGTGVITSSVAVSGGNVLSIFDQTVDTSFGGIIRDGTGGALVGLRKSGAGTLTLTGVNAYSGGTSVGGGGRLNVGNISGGSISGDVSVNDLGTLGGQGAIGGRVTVNSGGTLSGAQGQTLTMSSLTLDPGSILAVTLGAPAATGVFNVTGALTLDGTIDVTGAAGFGNGLYRVFDVGSITDNGLAVGATPAGYAAGDLTVQTTANQVNLLVGSAAPGAFTFWDGPNSAADNVVNGGSGTWSAAGTNWTRAGGSANGVYDPAAMLIFTGAAGIVTVDAGGGALDVNGGMQFFLNGYTVTGDKLNLSAPLVPIRVGDGTAAGASMTATIVSSLTGNGGIDKTDLGTLMLTGASAFSGEITVDGGTLAIRNGGSVSNAAGEIAKEDGTTSTVTVDGASSKWTTSSGVLVGVGANSSGTLNIANGGSVLQLDGDGIVGDGATGKATVDGAGSTWINSGTTSAIQVGILGGNGTLSITNRGSVSDTFGQIGYSGDGTVTVDGPGSTWVNASNLNVGTFGNGTLNVTNGGSVSSATAVLGNGGGANGTVTIDSAGSWTNIGALVVGQGGSGTINLNGVAGARGVLETQGVTKGQGAGTINFDGGILRATATNADLFGQFADGDVRIKAGGAFIDTNGVNVSASSTLSGSGALTKDGAGELLMTGANSYGGGTTISAGSLRLADNGTLGAPTGALAIASGGTLVFDTTTLTVGSLSGAGSITRSNFNSGVLTVNQATNTNFSGAITDYFDEINGVTTMTGLTKSGTGTLILSGNSAYTGATNVTGGTLLLDGVLGNVMWGPIKLSTSQIAVASGATLGGAGSIAGGVSVADGGILLGRAGQTLSLGSLVLNAGSVVDVSLGATSNTRLFNVTGNLTLAGTLKVSDAGSFGNGLYRLFDAGSITDNGLIVGTAPVGYTPGDLTVQRTANQVNLLVGAPVSPGSQSFWNGAQTTPNNVVNGGAGTWTATGTNWTNSSGNASGVYDSAAMLIFQGAPGAVTVDASGGALDIGGGMQFFVDGYQVSADALRLTTSSVPIRVGDGTAAGAGMTATISSAITGGGGIDKTDLGTLILSGANTYAGGTTISAGTLQLDGAGSLGAITGALSIASGGTLDLAGTNPTIGALSGAGNIFSSASGYTQSSLTVSQAGDTSYGGAITDGYSTGNGTGTVWLIKDGAGTLTLTGSSAFASHSVNGGTLVITNGGTVTNDSSYVGQASGANGAVLVTGSGSAWTTPYLNIGYQGAGALTIAAGGRVSADLVEMVRTASGTGVLNLNGAAGARGVLETGGVHKVRDGATVNFDGGILRATAADADLLSHFAPGDVTIKAGGAFIDTNGYKVEITSPLGGVGALTKQGAGELYVIGANSYGGGTNIAAGRLFIGDGGTLGASTGTLFIANGATLDLGITSQTVGSLSGAGTVTSTVSLGNTSLLTVNQNTDTTFSGAISNGIQILSPGSGSLPPILAPTVLGLTKLGAGTLIFGGSNNYTGATRVDGGTLLIDGTLGNTQVTVASGATLGGAGTIAGGVSVASGGILLGLGGQTLSTGSLVLNNGAVVDVSLGAPSNGRLFNVTGDLALNGTLNVGNAGGFGDGLYRLFDYSGALSGSGLTIGATPGGYAPGDMTTQTSVAHQVNLIVSSGPYIFWDGAGTTANGIVDGGSGVWSAAGTNWANVGATANGEDDHVATLVFVGTPGTVTVDAAGAGSLDIGRGLQFADNGFLVQGDGLTLTGGVTSIRVGDGTSAGANITATIASRADSTGRRNASKMEA